MTELIAELAQNSGSTVRFSEERRLQYLTEPLFAKGTLSFTPPGRLERQVLSPGRERMTVEGDLLTIEANPKDPPVRVLLSDYPALEAFITALRALLAGDRPTLEHIYAIALAGTEASWRLRLIPKSEQLRDKVREIHISGRAGAIRSIEVIEAGGDRSITTITGSP